MAGQAYEVDGSGQAHEVDGYDNSAGVPFVPAGWWELALGHELGRRSRVRSSGGTRPVQLVAVRVEDTSHRARRRFWPCSCDRPMNAEHAPACDWWNNRRPGTWWRNP